MRFNLQEGFPLLTTKQVMMKSIIAELLWFFDGGKDTGGRLSLEKLNEIQGKPLDAKNIWSHDQARFAAQGKAKFAGDCGRIYGAQWRDWTSHEYTPSLPIGHADDLVIKSSEWKTKKVDQLAKVIKQLKDDPFSRYHIINAWNPGEVDDMCLPPCHMKMQFFVREISGKKYLDLSMDQRSCDMFLGVPFNIASYALLIHMVAQCVDMEPGELVMTLEDCHIYLAAIKENNELDYTEGHEAQVREQMKRQPFTSPILKLNPAIKNIDDFTMNDIEIVDYVHHPAIKASLL
jgi:thymidylate synthase